MRVSEFNYTLPADLIAKHPPKIRGSSRLMAISKNSGEITHDAYANLHQYLHPGDTVVLNDTKVIKARLVATNASGQKREILLLEDHNNTDFNRRRALYRGKLHINEILKVGNVDIRINQIHDSGIAEINSNANLIELADRVGDVPLPPYLQREATPADTSRYQTVFAEKPGSVAAPTASLNFTDSLRDRLVQKGVQIVYLTLHVGLGTFLPIRSDNIEEHEMHSEYFVIPGSTIKTIQNSLHNSSNIVAVGTTVARTLEFAAGQILNGPAKTLSGEANIFIYPGYKFKVVNSLLTNFHAPKSTVLMLAAAFAGWKNLEHAYKVAIENEYAFLSYGDSMLIY